MVRKKIGIRIVRQRNMERKRLKGTTLQAAHSSIPRCEWLYRRSHAMNHKTSNSEPAAPGWASLAPLPLAVGVAIKKEPEQKNATRKKSVQDYIFTGCSKKKLD